MKPALLGLAGLVAAGLTFADNTSISGKWDVYTSIAGNDNNMTCTFAQKDADLTGSCETQRGTVEITGKVDGEKVTFSYKSEYEGTPLTVAYTGTVEAGTKIKGSVDVPEFGASGDFTANQSK
ncbi:MAG: hypothetical protein KGN84_12095 [Acidobacteriota bacterium]|nr:hypothetical protein [Acidobacteriota bacterium]